MVSSESDSVNDLLSTRLSRGQMIRLLTHPLPPSPVIKLDRRPMHKKTEKERHLADERGRMGEEANHMIAKKPGPP
jgi:hypothetical protein